MVDAKLYLSSLKNNETTSKNIQNVFFVHFWNTISDIFETFLCGPAYICNVIEKHIYIMKKNLLYLIFILVSACVYSQQSVSLVAMDLAKVQQDYGIPAKGVSSIGDHVIIDGKNYKDVLGLYGRSLMRVNLNGVALRFTLKAGVQASRITNVNDSSFMVQPLVDGSKLLFSKKGTGKQFKSLVGKDGKIGNGSVRLILRLDGNKIYDSGILSHRDGFKDINVDIRHGKILEIETDPTNDGASGDNVLLLSPVITYKENSESPFLIDVNKNDDSPGPVQSAKIVENLQKKLSVLPVMNTLISEKTNFDWLLSPEKSKAQICRTKDGKGLVIANAMVSRTFRIFPNLATVDYTNRMLGESMLRAVSSEGYVWINGKKWSVGGLAGQPERGFLKDEWLDEMKTFSGSFLVEDFEVKPMEQTIKWARSRWALNKEFATGKEVVFTLRGDEELKDVLAKVHFAIYDEIPVIKKWIEIENHSGKTLNINHFWLEYISFSEPESLVSGKPEMFRLPNIHVESDYACNGAFTEKETDITEKWVSDKDYTSQRNYLLETPCILQVAPPLGPNQNVADGRIFTSFNVYEMPFDSHDRERKGLFTRHFYKTVAPWTTENPIFMHLTSSKPEVVRTAIDQCAEVGYEMIILSFGSEANAENVSAGNIARFKELVEYARSKGIEMGCYSLLASRWISDEIDVINPQTGKRGGMRFGSSPCLCSEWGENYFKKIKTFFEQTGMRCFEHDGSYPGDVCASTSHPYHKGLEDSQWNQFYRITKLYKWMCEDSIYMNVPDFYFLNGSNKVGIGYREVNWSLPRDRQLIHTRQLNYDCTWNRIPSSLWSFVPLVEYHGGGKAATLEPLSEHLEEYRTLMFQNYGSGIQACYRGFRLYDTPETKQVVTEIISWYKKYRRILNNDIIHLRKPDARDWDGLMHVDPKGKEKALALFFNPTGESITRKIKLPLYYSGLSGKAMIREQEDKKKKYILDSNYEVELEVRIPANGYTWYVIE